MPDAVIVSVTCTDQAEAEAIAQALIARRLVACVQSHPISSRFVWEGKFDTGSEIMLTIKTRFELFAQVEQAVLELHSYDVPEILAMPVVAGHKPYLEWLTDQTAAPR